MSVTLTFVNKAVDAESTKIILFQQQANPQFNVPDFSEVIAWVVKESGSIQVEPTFIYKPGLQVSISDEESNFTPFYNVSPGHQYNITGSWSRCALEYSNPATREKEIQIVNVMNRGAVDVCCYHSGKLMYKWHNLVPEEMAVFLFKPNIFITVSSEAEEGKALPDNVVQNARVSLLTEGLESACIVLKGGGDEEYSVSLENTVYKEKEDDSKK
jgi:hypothetical protein